MQVLEVYKECRIEGLFVCLLGGKETNHMALKLKVLNTVNNKPFKGGFIGQQSKWLHCEDPK